MLTYIYYYYLTKLCIMLTYIYYYYSTKLCIMLTYIYYILRADYGPDLVTHNTRARAYSTLCQHVMIVRIIAAKDDNDAFHNLPLFQVFLAKDRLFQNFPTHH
jgi:hypothetical protein